MVNIPCCVRAALEVAIGLTTGPQCVVTPVVAEALGRALGGLGVSLPRLGIGSECALGWIQVRVQLQEFQRALHG